MNYWRVLVVEDDKTVAAIHCRHVSRQPGFSVVGVATSGPQALKLASILHPDLILLDLGLPGSNGISALRQLREADESTEVIVITGHANPKVVRTAVQLGVVDYLVKPFWPARLTEALNAFKIRAQALRGTHLNQADVDRARLGLPRTRESDYDAVKVGRLGEVQSALAARGIAMSADEVAVMTGMARVTARRYLEQLVGLGQCTVDQPPDGPGRPRKLYRFARPVGAPPAAAR